MKTQLLLSLSACFLFAPRLARAQVVTTAADAGAGSLRAVVAAAAPGATVTFDAGLSGQTILLTTGEILLNKSLTLDASALVAGIHLNGNAASRIFQVAGGATVTLNALTLTNGFANGSDGGAIVNAGTLTVNRCHVSGNQASATGGGILNNGTLTIRESTFSSNTAMANWGGGVENNGTVVVSRSTFVGNQANGGGAIDNNASLNVSESTFVSNRAIANDGGAIWAGGTVTVSNCTLVANIAPPGGAGGIAEFAPAAITIVNSIVAQNSTVNIGGGFTGHSNLTAGDPVLLPLGHYGGFTQTRPPAFGSPAIDAGGVVSSPLDQRGFPRVNGVGSDIGAVELQIAESFYNPVRSAANSGPFTLRAAIGSAPPGSTITFAADLIGQTITLTTGELFINQSLTIVGPGAASLALSGNFASRVFNVSGGVTLNLAGLTLRNGRTGGGANSGAAGSPGGNGMPGGGIFNAGTLNLTNCVITGNVTGGGGAGWPPVNPAPTAATPGGMGGLGGGIYNQGILRLFGCTVNANGCGPGGFGGFGNWTTNTGGLGGRGGDGGGIYNASGGSLILQSCTVAGNASGHGGGGGNSGSGAGGNPGAHAGGGGNGGNGCGIASAGTATLTACTISGNFSGDGGSGGFAAFGFSGGGPGSPGSGGGVHNSVATPATCDNTIIALNSAPTAPDVSGAFSSAGHNFIGKLEGSSGFGVATDIFGTIASPKNPLLGALANNGGGTLTMALLPASPALETGRDALAAPLITDQRGAGFPRQRGAHVDIGAYELDLPGYAAPTIVAQSAGAISFNPVTQLGSLPLNATVNPNAFVSTAWLQFGLTTSYGNATAPVPLGSGTINVVAPLSLAGLAPGLTWHYRVVAASAVGTNYGPDQIVNVSVAGDANGDGVVSQSELDAVYGNYVTNSPWLLMTNVAGLGGTNVTFALEGSPLGAYTVEYSTNLTDWQPLGPATPRYGFSDTNAPALPQRHYRLRYP